MYILICPLGDISILYSLEGIEDIDSFEYFEIDALPEKPGEGYILKAERDTQSVYWEKPWIDWGPLRNRKTLEVSNQCQNSIYAGIDVETTQGTEHFSLEETDQINLQAATAAIQAGAGGYPYHADGKLCRIFTAEEITRIGNEAISHKMYHTTYCNHMFEWIRRAEGEELQNIQYGAELPDDLKASMEAVLTDAANL